MSVSLYRYTEDCAGKECPGDCDLCKENMEMNLFDEEELHPNATVQILRNTITGVVSIGWWDNE